MGEPIVFVVPEDRIKIAPGGAPAAENGFLSQIVGEEFVGASVRVYADDGTGREIKALASYGSEEFMAIRSQKGIALSWSAADAYVLPS